MIRTISGTWSRLASLALALLACSLVAGCGGSVSAGPTTPTSAGPLAITPSTATLYSDLPTTFVITGGSGVYTVVSSDQNVVPVAGVLSGSAFTVAPTEVAADTPVTLTVRDNAGSLPATATLTVKPRTINNSVTITPSAGQAASCGNSVCSGGDAEVAATLSQAGIPLTNRTVRFDVVSGDIGLIVSGPGQPEQLALTATTTSDSTGTARERIRVSAAISTSQTALLRITDVSSGFTQTTSVTIAPSTNAALNAQPDTIRFTGPNSTTCSLNGTAEVIVFGGLPPYTLTRVAGYTLSRTTVPNSGGDVTITANGQCSQTETNGTTTTPIGSPLAIVDAAGATKTITLFNTPAPSTPTSTTDFNVSPTDVTLDTCNAIATVALVGGTGRYFVGSGSNALAIDFGQNLATIKRRTGTTTTLDTVNVGFTDGQSVKPVIVHIVQPAAGAC